jgi:hypothetical protein
MAKQARDGDDDRSAKKASSNTLLFMLIGGAVAVLGLCCLCAGGGTAGFYLGWFGGDKKSAVGKNNENGKEIDPGIPRGKGPNVTKANFDRVTKQRMSLAEAEAILGPGLPVKGAVADEADIYLSYNQPRRFLPKADVYQWSNDRWVYFIFFDNGKYAAHGGDLIENKFLDKK